MPSWGFHFLLSLSSSTSNKQSWITDDCDDDEGVNNDILSSIRGNRKF